MQPPQPTTNSAPLNEASQRLAKLQGFLKQDPDNLSLRSQAVAAAIAAGAWSDAEQLLQEGFSKHPQAAELLAHAGFVALHQQDFEQAKAHFIAAIEQGVTAPAVRYNLAFAYFYLANYQAALDALELLPAGSVVAADATLLSARCLHHLDKRDLAIAALQMLPAMTTEAEGLLALLLHEVDRGEDALAAANRVLAGNPSQLEALLARAGTLMEQEQYEQAHHDFVAATAAHPHSGRAWSGLAQLDFRDFKFEEALTSLKKAVEHMPNHIGTWHTLAWVYILQGNIAEAKKAFDRSYELDRNFGETHGGLAVIAAMEDQPKLAEEYIKRAMRLNPHGFAAQYAKMLLLEKQGNVEDAKKLFTTVMQTANPGIGFTPQVLVDRRMQELAKKHQH